MPFNRMYTPIYDTDPPKSYIETSYMFYVSHVLAKYSSKKFGDNQLFENG